jgi:hypothetical protein
MNTEIKDIRLILPAMVTLKQDDEELSVFVYIDQARMDVVIPDPTGIKDVDEFKKAFAKYYTNKNPSPKSPEVPKNMFKQVDVNTFKGDFNG